MTVLWIGGQAMPDPAYRGYTTRREELVHAKRNVGNVLERTATGIIYDVDDGTLIKKRIALKYTIDIQWKGLTYAQKNQIMSATSGEDFSVDFIDLDTDAKKTGYRMYRGTGQTITGYGTYDPATKRFPYYDVSMSLIQL